MVTTYLVFSGNCAEALSFYQQVFQSAPGLVQAYGDYVPSGLLEPPSGLRDKILHAEMNICGSTFWFADEVYPSVAGNQVRLTATVPTAAEARRIFEALSPGAQISLPPTQTFYSAFHAALTDKFGICWNVVAEEAPQQD